MRVVRVNVYMCGACCVPVQVLVVVVVVVDVCV